MSSPIAAALAQMMPPRDPRTALPAFGALPVVARLDEITWRVIAPNPSPMTLDGTNTYLLDGGDGQAAIIDPGPDDAGHLDRVVALVEELDVAVVAVLTTHHHIDHAQALLPWAARFGATAWATTPTIAQDSARLIAPDDTIDVGAIALEVVATPGHCADHVAFRTPTGALLAGDHILGRGTSVVAYPDGDLTAYLASLRRVLDLGPDALHPGHGPELLEDPGGVVRYYLEHRAFREAQVLAVVRTVPASVATIVEHVYADVDHRLWPAAEASTRACLDRLVTSGTVRFDGDVVHLIGDPQDKT